VQLETDLRKELRELHTSRGRAALTSRLVDNTKRLVTGKGVSTSVTTEHKAFYDDKIDPRTIDVDPALKSKQREERVRDWANPIDSPQASSPHWLQTFPRR
jgi:hypothetical protein